MDGAFWVGLIILLAVIYLIDVYERYDPDENEVNKQTLTCVKKSLFALALLVTVLGFTVYLGEQKLVLGTRFKLFDFIFKENDCSIRKNSLSVVNRLVAAAKHIRDRR